MFTLQSMFDTSCNALLAQGRKSIIVDTTNSIEKCKYRGTNGAKCAIGHVISDDLMMKYHIHEGRSARSLPLALWEDLVSDVEPEKVYRFAIKMQIAHDSSDDDNFVESFLAAANQIATDFGLIPISRNAK